MISISNLADGAGTLVADIHNSGTVSMTTLLSLSTI